ncbi:MAG: Holliday junction resolvase RuvX [Phycisphaerales bacterium]|nr:MAG: Holliday junction resolvase RuvX [Phycisphaerales bacterium]
MRYLAIDLGEKRTGLASGDDATGVVGPLCVIAMPRGEVLMNTVLKEIEAYSPDAIVIGLPLNMDGTEGEAAKEVRRFGDALKSRSGKPVHYQDERLTSYAADQQMAQSGRTHRQKKELRDALAAAEILRDFLDA